MKKSLLLLVFGLFTTCAFAQPAYRPYTFPQTVPDVYRINSYADYDSLRHVRKPRYVKRFDYNRYCELEAYGKAAMFNSGEVYIDWAEVESYLNDVMQRLLPDSLKGRENLRVFVQRNPDFNAHSIYDGSYFINVGLLAELNSEAGLAMVMGHELAHYLYQDGRDRYTQMAKIEKRKNKEIRTVFDWFAYLRGQEMRCDSLAYMLMLGSKYDIAAAKHTFYLFELDEEKYKQEAQNEKNKNKARSKRETEADRDAEKLNAILQLLRTHPPNPERTAFLEKVISEQREEEGKNRKLYQVNKKRFHEMQRLARYETLEILLTQCQYRLATERALSYYLQQPEDDNLLYYLTESLR